MADFIMPVSDKRAPPAARIWLVILLWIAGCVLVGIFSSRYQRQEVLQELEQNARNMARLLEESLQPYHDIVETLAGLKLMVQVLNSPPDDINRRASLQRFLQNTNKRLGSESLFLLDSEGYIVGSSIALSAEAVAQSYAFRPYFQQSILGEPGRYYGISLLNSERGYFFSAPVRDQGRVIGVAVVNVNLEPLFRRLSGMSQDYLLPGYDGVIFAASRGDWNYHSLYPLAASQKDAIQKLRRYVNSSFSSITADNIDDVFSEEKIRLRFSGFSDYFLMRRARIPELGWHLFALAPLQVLYQRVGLHLLFYSTLFTVLLLLWLYWRKRAEVQLHIAHLNTELERRVDALTRELTDSNIELTELVNHYRKSQSQLQETRDQLVQTAKLAILGEMSASINHELNQPLLALQTYAENSLRLSQRQRYEVLEDNLHEILHITTTMHSIVSRFKVFARRTPPEPRAVDIKEIIEGTRVIITPLLNKTGVLLKVEESSSLTQLYCDPVQIQQVLVNLATNAAEALEGQADAWIKICIELSGKRVRFSVSDSGAGVAPELRSQIFEPFFTTKASGLGLGLALSRRIIETLGGELNLQETMDGKTCFVVDLPGYPIGEH